MKMKIKICNNCGSEYSSKETESKYCSRKCAISVNNTNVVRNGVKRPPCIICGKTVGKNSLKFCSQEHATQGKQESYIARWKANLETGMRGTEQISNRLRLYIWQKYGSKCVRCGWCEPHPSDGKPPLQIEHINGNWQDNREENLILLCPNCHSLTTTYGGRNIGKGRTRTI